jgi:DNA-binding IclR family transcriptional regulator
LKKNIKEDAKEELFGEAAEKALPDDKKYIKSVLKALAVIELLDEHGELGVTEIGRLLELDKSTVFRLLATLREKKFIIADPRTQKYRNGSKFFMLGRGVVRQRGFNPAMEAELERLSAQTGEVVSFSVPDGTDIVTLAMRETEEWTRLAVNIGQRRPMYCNSMGKAVLAAYKPEFARSLCEQFEYEAFTEYTHRGPDTLLRELAQIRERGYSTDEQEHRLGLCCVGIAILDSRNEPAAAVSVSMPVYKRIADPELHGHCLRLLLDAKERLRAALFG